LRNNHNFLLRAQGSLLGLAIGDALGTTLEFKKKDSFQPIKDMNGGGPFNLEAGQWTDDTAMALCLADSLLECGEHNAQDQIERYIRWRDTGYNSCTNSCFDIGITISNALCNFERTNNPNAGSTTYRSAGNGSIMRLAPIVIFYAESKGVSLQQTIERAAESSLTTHGEQRSVEACRVLAHLLSTLLLGQFSKEEVMYHVLSAFPVSSEQTLEINELRLAVELATLTTTPREQIFGRGYVVDSLQAAIWCFMRSNNFKDGALLAANLGDDADTTCAIYGQIAGAYYGFEGIPESWLNKLYWREKISDTAACLAAYSITVPSITYFKLKEPNQISALEHLDLNDAEQQALIKHCPILDLRVLQTRESLFQHIQAFLRYTYEAPELKVQEMSSLNDLERFYYAKLDGIDVSDVAYGQIFCDSKGEGGLSDQGLANYFIVCEDLPETLGVDGSSSPIKEHDFSLENFTMDWITIADLIDGFLLINQAYLPQRS
jgi:ADP-ribosylglycohydrolase